MYWVWSVLVIIAAGSRLKDAGKPSADLLLINQNALPYIKISETVHESMKLFVVFGLILLNQDLGAILICSLSRIVSFQTSLYIQSLIDPITDAINCNDR